jgi:CO/xanthine dehydrogenase FAD-binding subunit
MSGAALVVESREAAGPVTLVLDLARLPELNRVEYDERLGLLLGACVCLRDLAAFPPIAAYGLLTDALERMAACGGGDASVGEVLSRPARAGHLACPLICLRCSAAVYGPHGWSELGLDGLFASALSPGLQSREFLVDLRLPAPPPRSAGAYVSAPDGAEATCGAAALLAMDEDGRRCCGARLSLWVTGRAVTRLLEAERFLAGKRLDRTAITEAAILADDGEAPVAAAIHRAAARLAARHP